MPGKKFFTVTSASMLSDRPDTYLCMCRRCHLRIPGPSSGQPRASAALNTFKLDNPKTVNCHVWVTSSSAIKICVLRSIVKVITGMEEECASISW